MAEFPKLEHSMMAIRRAGEALKSELVWSEGDRPEEFDQAFRIAHNWRDSHFYPMTKIRAELIGKIRKLRLRNGNTAARLKRMPSIRRKLRAIQGNLTQMQDLGGCRVILNNIADVNAFLSAHKSECEHVFAYEKDYIGQPKIGGYRSHHLIWKFQGRDGHSIHDGRRIEVQVRSGLQHSWATAVEAVGTIKQNELKSGQGNPEWLRLFELVSAELAIAEGCEAQFGLPSSEERRKEIRDLDRKLNALSELENMRHAFLYTEEYVRTPNSDPKFFLIRYDNVEMKVEVRPYFGALESAENYEKLERSDQGNTRYNTVLVQSSKIEALKVEFPNYFGDVQFFTENLQRIVRNGVVQEYTMPPLEVKSQERVQRDDSWMRRTGRWKHEEYSRFVRRPPKRR